MTNEWIIDVLGDMRRFARSNAMPLLAETLADALAAAHVEAGCPARRADPYAATAGRNPSSPAPGAQPSGA